MYLENDENTDWKALDPPSYNSRLLELSVDEGEDLGSGNQDCMNCELYQSRVMISFLFDVNQNVDQCTGFDDYEIFFNGLQVVKEEGRA